MAMSMPPLQQHSTPARKPLCDQDVPVGDIQIINDFQGVCPFLDDEALSDIRVRLPDDSEMYCHRLLLAAASDVLKAKFLATFRDSQDEVWNPEVGAPSTWHWILGWIYGHDKSLPLGSLVDALLIADHFQMRGLAAGLRAVPVADMAEAVAQQLLQAWAWPDILTAWARLCVPLAATSRSVWLHLWEARPQNAAVVIRFLPVLCEADRLRLCGEYLRRSHDTVEHWPDIFLEAVRWDSFPAATLDAAYRGDCSALEAVAGVPFVASDDLKGIMHDALVRRCRFLEDSEYGSPQLDAASLPQSLSHIDGCTTDLPLEWGYLADHGLDTLGPPAQRSPGLGLFARMAEKQLSVRVCLSSSHYLNGPDPLALLAPDTRFFGTDKQSTDDLPWIELSSDSCCVRPLAIGLKHGWSESDFCEHFVVEAACEAGPWEPIIKYNAPRRLKSCGEVLLVQAANDGHALLADMVRSREGERDNLALPPADRFFDRFRIRMTGPNSSSNWYLMIAWFDVFGQFQTKRRPASTCGNCLPCGATPAAPAIAVAQRRVSGLQHFAV